jgi:oligoendopeptidase F
MTPDQGTATQALPIWNLGDLYSGPDAPEVERDLKEAAAKAADFRQQY